MDQFVSRVKSLKGVSRGRGVMARAASHVPAGDGGKEEGRTCRTINPFTISNDIPTKAVPNLSRT
jgi:hypothetical protein